MRETIVRLLVRLWDKDGHREHDQIKRLKEQNALRERSKSVARRSNRVAEVVSSYSKAGDALTR